jgi:hypothetical protein
MRARTLLIVAALSWLALPSPAHASGAGEAGGSTGDDGAQVVVVIPGSSSGGFNGTGYQGGGGPASNIDCKFFGVTASAGAVLPSVGSQITDTSTLEVDTYVWLICRDITTGSITFENIFPWDPADPPVLTPSAQVLAQMAANGMVLPMPGVQTWPPSGGKGLVNLPVWMHVDNWETLSASASAGGLTATVEAVPVRAEWDMDDGSVVCTDAGSTYDTTARPDPASSSCSYTYRRSSGARADLTFHNSAVVVWHLRWYATNGQGGDLGELSSPVAGFDLQIEESQALVAPARS